MRDPDALTPTGVGRWGGKNGTSIWPVTRWLGLGLSVNITAQEKTWSLSLESIPLEIVLSAYQHLVHELPAKWRHNFFFKNFFRSSNFKAVWRLCSKGIERDTGQCFGYGFIDSGSRILGWIPIRIQDFDDKNKNKNLQLKKMQLISSLAASIKEVQATAEACGPQNRTSSTSKLQNKMKFLNLFYFCGRFCPPGSGFTDLIESGSNTDLKHRYRCW